ncbi:Embryonic abundant protein [Vigna angularis]|uniref:Embryonic abundant protein n=1 Tax=Phaseolus angularis TaxID=3914 RepID=A0A8T0KAL6_PHAAN|nr:embryonic abundant protein USP92 [Vigna angularis]KAG2396857.1 Embryonic abundant protein [Vigna angularis]
MEFGHLIFLAFLCLTLRKIDASQSAKDYWDSVFPNTSVPEPLQDLVFPPKKTNLPIKVNEEKQYWTLFFEHDLHPRKMMRLGLHNYSDTKPSTRTTSQPFGAWLQAKISEKYSLDEVCGKAAGKGEHKFCAASLESMMGFAISKLGKNIRVVSSSFDENHDRYSVEEVKKVGEKAVMCHRLNFEKVVFYCHQVNATTTYMVPLVASDGAKAKALTICHHDTRGMDPVVLYQVLRVKPGTVPVCHFVGNKTLAWVPNLGTKESCSA